MSEDNQNAFANLKTDRAFDNSGDPNARKVTKSELVQLNTSSLLIESLVEQWCNSLGENPNEQHKLYLTICEKLFQKKLIDDSFRHDKFKFMRSHYQKAFFHVINIAKNSQPEIVNQQLMLLPRNFSIVPKSERLFQWSRYRDDFEELEFIARGGFGHVYKAKNKLDNGIYAVKKIFLSYSDVNAFLRSLHEVQMLAKLNHPNIVSYKAAWLEPVEPKAAKPPETFKISDDFKDEISARLKNDASSVVIFKNSSDSSSASNQSPKKSSSSNHTGSEGERSGNGKILRKESSSSNHTGSEGERSGNGKILRKEGVPLRKKNGFSTTSDESEEGCKALCEHRHAFNINFQNDKTFPDSAILFIQMQLCKQTLRHWLHSRNSIVNKPLNLRHSFNLFEQIISGVEYIHSKNIVHHDIKPSNIFISDNFQVAQVGDFGLACLLTHSHDHLNHDTNDFVMCPLQQRQFGTKLYAAPEQLQGTCTPKSDIYSLGIVLLELVYPFMTEMERIKVISKVQSGSIPPEFERSSPEIAHIVLELLDKDPDKRPTAKELLILVKKFREMHSTSSKVIADKNKIIEELRTELKEKDKIILELQRKLKSFEEVEK